MLSRRDFLSTTAAASVAALIPGLSRAQTSSGDPALDKLFDGFVEQMLADSPETATFLGFDGGDYAALKHRLADRSIAGAAAVEGHVADRLRLLKAFGARGLKGMAKVNYDCAVYAHELGADGAKFAFGDNSLGAAMSENTTPYVVSQMTGDFPSVPEFLDSQHKIETPADADAYLDRLDAFAAAMAGETERIRRDAAAGVTPPDFILETTLKQMTGFRAVAAADSRLVQSLAGRVKAKGFEADYAGRATSLVEQKVYPALDAQIAALQALQPTAVADAGVWKLPQGDAYYAWLLKVGANTAMSAEQIHKMGLDQVKQITARMDGLLKAQGLSEGSVGVRVKALSKDPRFVYPNTDEGRAQIIDYLNGRLAAVRGVLPKAFNTLNKADVVVKRVPPDIQAGAPLGYEQDGAFDGSRPATYYINLQDTAIWPRWKLPTLTYHETIPGHVWQGSYLTERHILPLIRSFFGFNAYVEGWALYSEQMADELGLYADDPWGQIGYLQAQQFRACRLVVDTGLHAKRWNRERAIDWLMQMTGYGRPEAQSEIDRYCVTPGQACGYKVGHTEFERLRDKAKAALGAKFDLRAFNDAVVLCGGVPLTVLAKVVDGYVASAKG